MANGEVSRTAARTPPTLSPVQRRAVELLAEGSTPVEKVAKELGVARRTLWAWRKDPTFATTLAEFEAELDRDALQHAVTRRSERLAGYDERQDDGKLPPNPAIIRVVIPLPTEPNRDEVLKERMLHHLADTPRLGRCYFLSSDRWSWAALRQMIGGRVRAAHFRRLVDELIAEGKVVEVWEAKVDGWSWRHQHVLVLAERFHDIAWYRFVQVVGREDVLERLGIEEGR